MNIRYTGSGKGLDSLEYRVQHVDYDIEKQFHGHLDNYFANFGLPTFKKGFEQENLSSVVLL